MALETSIYRTTITLAYPGRLPELSAARHVISNLLQVGTPVIKTMDPSLKKIDRLQVLKFC